MAENIVITTKEMLEGIIEETVNKAISACLHLQGSTKLVHDPTKDEFLNIESASSFTKLAKQTLYQMVCERRIPHLKIGARVFFYRNELVEWMKQGKKTVKTN
ncbi:helix-turn-helix transcriptional regulator [Lacihabitans soyangensis]|uniref:DNA-binding protein n=1 Tax=Lacihabitans soyangensis TaxID=869394 RepID=A0AAE3KU92_9BACT|nr:helix-turn-helix domain-containing protein [Lacihabitans soyangensis]MCP9762966.1 DNA-binding protein [Lacihabitans soyangensis]